MAEDIKNGIDGMSYEVIDAAQFTNGTEIDFQQGDPRLKSLSEIRARRVADELARPIEKANEPTKFEIASQIGMSLHNARTSVLADVA